MADDRTRKSGGVIHTYLGYDPTRFPSPTKPPPDIVSSAFDHLLTYGSTRELTPEELARAVHLDPSEIRGLGPSLDSLIARLEERKRKLLERYETESVRERAEKDFHSTAAEMRPHPRLERTFRREVRQEQLRGLERLWYAAEREDPPFAAGLPGLIDLLGAKYEVDALAARYAFTGREPLSVEDAVALKA